MNDLESVADAEFLDEVRVVYIEGLIELGLGSSDSECVRPCSSFSPFEGVAKKIVAEEGGRIAVEQGYDVVVLGNPKKSFFNMKYEADLEFYKLSERVSVLDDILYNN